MKLDFTTLFMGILFGLIGLSAWIYGRKNSSARHMLLGAVLMVFSYFIDRIWVTLLIGGGLTGLLFWP